MSYPYLADIANAIFGARVAFPIPTFGTLVAISVLLSMAVARREVARKELVGALPPLTHKIVADLVLIAIVFGLVGAKVFSILDYPQQFADNPASMIFSRVGFSIYGGLLFGTLAGMVFLKRRATPILPMLDACAPSMMLGYAIGRIGCQLSGDGDWGIAATIAAKPNWLPEWFWAQTYDGNIAGIFIPTPGVYPTPIYECFMALGIFGVLWILRSKHHRAGYLFSVYLLLAGFERLLIEKIRINVDYHLLGMTFTQAEAISFVLIIAGAIGILITLQRRRFWMRITLAVAVVSALTACVRL